MINKFVNDLATHSGVKISKVTLNGGSDVACQDYILGISSKGHSVKTIVNQLELEGLQKCSPSGFLEMKIKTALERLKILQES